MQKQKEKKIEVYLQSIFVALQNNIKITIKYFFFQSEDGRKKKKTGLPTLFWKHRKPKPFNSTKHNVPTDEKIKAEIKGPSKLLIYIKI